MAWARLPVEVREMADVKLHAKLHAKLHVKPRAKLRPEPSPLCHALECYSLAGLRTY